MNGVVVRELGVRADLRTDVVTVDGERVAAPGRRRTIALHKPRGVVSTLEDPEGRPTVARLVAETGERLFPVGRLDLNTSGVLLLTNDGALTAALLHPRHAVPRIYVAKVRGTPPDEAVVRLRRGVRLEDGKTAPARVRVIERLPTKTWLQITVYEGRQHLVRRMCAAVGHPVEKLSRVAFGPVALRDLPPGAWRDLGPGEVAALRQAAGLSGGRAAGAATARPARGKRRRTPRARAGPRSPDESRSAAPAAPRSRS